MGFRSTAVLSAILLVGVLFGFLLWRFWPKLFRWFASRGGPLPTPDLQERLLRPDFAALEQFYGRPLPQGVKELYKREDLLALRDFFILDPDDFNDEAWHIQAFTPADAKAVADSPLEGKERFVFARNALDDVYYVRVDGPPESSPAVHLFRHGECTTDKVADSLEEFLKWERITADEFEKQQEALEEEIRRNEKTLREEG